MTSLIQRIESGLIAAFALATTIAFYPTWWWVPFAAFLLFDLSALGYLRSPSTGAVVYNLVHSYAWPALVGIVAVVFCAFAVPGSTVLALIALSWAFHVGADRALGYGLKLPDAFTHTHLGWIGKDRGK